MTKVSNIRIQQIRNATIIIEYAWQRILVDPMLGEKGSMPPFSMSIRQDHRNPLNDLPIVLEDVLKDIDVVLLTHLHEDHIDEKAYEVIPKTMRMLVQDEKDKAIVEAHGFTQVEVVGDHTYIGKTKVEKAESQHGYFPMYIVAGHTTGYVLSQPNEKTLYHAGDTIWYSGVKRNLAKFQPEVITLNAGGNKFHVGGRVIMNDEDVVKVMQTIPNAQVFVTHLEGVNHNHVTRAMVNRRLKETGLAHRAFVPQDGEIIAIS